MTKAYSQHEPSQDQIRKAFFYKDGELLWKKKTTRKPVGSKAGTVEKDGYVRIRFMGRKVYAHRLIWIFHHGACPDLIDHIDRDKSNNRIENLRAATKSQNALNSKIPKTSLTTGVRGVHAVGDKFVARVIVDGRRQYLGMYEDIDSARLAYRLAVKDQLPKSCNPPS
jgi:hypothetical protein